MKMNSFAFVVTSAFLIAIPPANAQFEADLILPDSPFNVGEAGVDISKGSYGRIAQAVIDKTGISHKVVGTNRAYNAFYAGKYGCVSPDSKLYYGEDAKYLDSASYNVSNWLVITQQDSAVIGNKEQLAGKKVGLTYQPDALLPVVPQSGVKYEVKDDNILNLKKLVAGRLDAVVMDESALNVILGVDPAFSKLTYDVNQPIAKVPDAFMCHDTPEGRALLDKINTALQEIGNDGIEQLKAE